MSQIFDADSIQAVVEHMNEEHQDACLCIARAFSTYIAATSATLTGFDCDGLHMKVTDMHQMSHSVKVAFDKPLTRESQIRGILVAMTKRARATLNDQTQ